MTADPDDQNLCAKYVSHHRLSAWIVDHGKVGHCDFAHGPEQIVVAVSAFAEEVDTFFRENYQLGEEARFCGEDDRMEYYHLGEPYKDVLREQLECDDDVVEAISDQLPDVTDHDVMQGDEPFYDDTANYESVAAADKRHQADEADYWYEQRFSLAWKDFCRKVQFQRRFFEIKEPLDDLFGSPIEYETGSIKPVYDLPVGEKIYRARLLDDHFTEDHLNENPSKCLGAPPKKDARAGRMNVEYIPAFYAAFSEETAIAEVRPGIGEEIAIGEFVSRCKLRVFDFTAFSTFRSGLGVKYMSHSRYDFIQQMEEEISRPVLPYEKQREYIPTQIVAEYIKEYFECDGIIFRSSMITGHTKERRNIVLFEKERSFIDGGNALLKLIKRDIKNVLDVTYSVGGRPF